MSSLITYEWLGILGLGAGFLSAIAGSSGLIILPVLLLMGIPPQIALGTNKLYTTASLLTSAYYFTRRGLFNPRFWMIVMVAAIIGTLLGTGLTQIFSNETLKMLLPILIGLMAIYLLIPKKPSIPLNQPLQINSLKSLVTTACLGIYSGFLGAGTGSLWTMTATNLYGINIMNASAISRFMCFISNSVALFILIFLGQVDYTIGTILSISGAVGAYLGSRIAVRCGPKFIRTMLVGSTLVLAGNLAITHWI
jgi:uncharacterized protein